RRDLPMGGSAKWLVASGPPAGSRCRRQASFVRNLLKQGRAQMETISELRRKAAELVYSGKDRDAARIYEQILKTRAPDGEIALRLGSLRRRLRDLVGALASFELAAELWSGSGRFGQAAAAEQIAADLTREIGLE